MTGALADVMDLLERLRSGEDVLDQIKEMLGAEQG